MTRPIPDVPVGSPRSSVSRSDSARPAATAGTTRWRRRAIRCPCRLVFPLRPLRPALPEPRGAPPSEPPDPGPAQSCARTGTGHQVFEKRRPSPTGPASSTRSPSGHQRLRSHGPTRARFCSSRVKPEPGSRRRYRLHGSGPRFPGRSGFATPRLPQPGSPSPNSAHRKRNRSHPLRPVR